jgi:hypothetical protein
LKYNKQLFSWLREHAGNQAYILDERCSVMPL